MDFYTSRPSFFPSFFLPLQPDNNKMMNKTRFYTTFFLSAMLLCSKAQITPTTQMEKLDRGLVALPASSGNFVSWRFLGTDDSNTHFDLVRNGSTIATDLTVSNFKDTNGDSNSEYQVVTKVNGETINTSDAVKAWDKVYKTLKLDLPAKGAQGGNYSPNDCSVGDVDGDGEYEIY